MPNQKVEVIPYLCGANVRISVSVDGKEVYDDEHPLSTLFAHFATVTDESDALEASQLIVALESGVRTIQNLF